MKFLSHVSSEIVPPATFRLWRHAGVIEYLPLWICITAPSIFFAVTDHSYYKVLEFVAIAVALIIGLTLLPAKQVDKPARAVDYLPACIVMMAPPIIVAALDRRYDHVLEILVVAFALIILVALLPIRWTATPAVELENDVLTIRMRHYIPAKRERILLPGLRQVVITGPGGNRDWIFESNDGAKKEIRPYFDNTMDDAFASLLRSAANGRFTVITEAPYELEP